MYHVALGTWVVMRSDDSTKGTRGVGVMMLILGTALAVIGAARPGNT